ncbi:MAG: DUF885 domain-containing protein [Arenimonas sp.]
MKRIFRWGFRAAFLILALFALFAAHTIWFKPVHIRLFFERVFIEYALEDPQLLSSLRILPAWLDWYSDDLTDLSLAHSDKLDAKVRNDLATLRSYDRAALSGDNQLSYDMLESFLAIQAEGEKFGRHNYPLNQLFGVQNELPTFMATQHAITSLADGDNYVTRLDKFPLAYRQLMGGLLKRESEGIIPPRFVIEKVLTEMRAFVAAPARQNVLYTSLVERLDKLPAGAADADERKALLARTEASISGQVYPAYRTLIAYYDKLLPKAQANNGVWALPDGVAYYAWAVRAQTTTEMTPAQVHALGVSEVARIEAEMDPILRGEGLTEGSVGQRLQQIARRPDQLYPDTDAGRAQIIADFQKIIDDSDKGLSPYFDVRPKQGVTVERVPQFREKTAPGAYYNTGSFDGSRPGTFYINLRNTAEIPKFGMRTLAYHEAIPGHHFQKTIQQELTGVPTFRKLLPFTAFAEGWALYSERLAWEIGYEKQPLDNLGRLQAEMFRAVRLVVDTGLHKQRWTREQAIAYMLDKTGMPETDVVAEIERYLVMPGQALAYKVGMTKILQLRERAKAGLGDRFDLKRFHSVVLTGGDMPLALLERRVDAWIAGEKLRH